MNTLDEAMEISLNWDHLNAVAGFASCDESRYVLNSVCFEINGESGRLVATDGRRLGVLRVTFSEWLGVHRLIVPVSLIRLAKAFRKSPLLSMRVERSAKGEDLFDGIRLTFSDGDCSISGWAIEGKYPIWTACVPRDHGRSASFLAFDLGLVAECLAAVKGLSGGKGLGVYVRKHGSGPDADGQDRGAYTLQVAGCPDFFGVLMPIAHDGELGAPDWAVAALPEVLDDEPGEDALSMAAEEVAAAESVEAGELESAEPPPVDPEEEANRSTGSRRGGSTGSRRAGSAGSRRGGSTGSRRGKRKAKELAHEGH